MKNTRHLEEYEDGRKVVSSRLLKINISLVPRPSPFFFVLLCVFSIIHGAKERHFRESKTKLQPSLALEELCRDVVSRPRPELTLPLYVPTLRHAHQSGHLIRKESLGECAEVCKTKSGEAGERSYLYSVWLCQVLSLPQSKLVCCTARHKCPARWAIWLH